MNIIKRKLNICYYFGTNGCGLCYAIKNELRPRQEASDSDDDSDSSDDADNQSAQAEDKDDNKDNTMEDKDGYYIVNHEWDDIAYDNSKLNTCILLDDKNEFQMFGNTARITFAESQKNDWKLFDNFKMSLYR